MQTFIRTCFPSIVIRLRCTFGLNVREVRGALRFQRPECLCRMLRPKLVRLSHTSHLPAIAAILATPPCHAVLGTLLLAAHTIPV